DDRRLAEHDAATPHVDERVGRAEIDGHIAAAKAGEVRKEAHARADRTSLGQGDRAEGAVYRSVSAPKKAAKRPSQCAPNFLQPIAMRLHDPLGQTAVCAQGRGSVRELWLALLAGLETALQLVELPLERVQAVQNNPPIGVLATQQAHDRLVL